jgi:hypothetical protein
LYPQNQKKKPPKKPEKINKFIASLSLSLSLSLKERKKERAQTKRFISFFHFMSELYLHCLFWVNGIWGQLIKW